MVFLLSFAFEPNFPSQHEEGHALHILHGDVMSVLRRSVLAGAAI